MLDFCYCCPKKVHKFTFPWAVYSLQKLGIIIENLLFLFNSMGKNNVLLLFLITILSVVKYSFIYLIAFQILLDIFIFIVFVHFSNFLYILLLIRKVFFGLFCKLYWDYFMNIAITVLLKFVICPSVIFPLVSLIISICDSCSDTIS